MSHEVSIHGYWVYADDPTGELATDPVYTGSLVHFGADGTYAFSMGQITLQGTYEVLESAETVQTRVTLVNGAQMDISARIRDGGIVIHEGDGTLPGRFYLAKPFW
jgi:hypothetical protein